TLNSQQDAIQLRDFDSGSLVGRPDVLGNGKWLVGRFFTGDNFRVWDLVKKEESEKKRATYRIDEGVAEVLSVPSSPLVFLRGNATHTVRGYNLTEPRVVLLRGHDQPVRTFACSRGGRWLLTGGQDGTVRAWDLRPLESKNYKEERKAELAAKGIEQLKAEAR